MSGTLINPSNYPDLYTYGILSQTGISFSGTTVNYGDWGSAGPITGVVSTTTANSNNPVLVPTATAELGNATSLPGTLFYDILNNGFPSTTISNNITSNITFLGNNTYIPTTSSSSLDFSSVIIYFNAQDNPNAQFFIITDDDITFTNVSFSLQNKASPQNIFWLSTSGSISHTTPSASPTNTIQGNFIADQSITFGNPSQLFIITANLYANASIIFGNNYKVNAKTIPLPVPEPFNTLNYPTLFSFSIVSGNDIAFNNTSVNGGNYGASGTITGLPTTGSGLNDPNNDLSTALLELGNLSSGAGTLVFDLVNNGYGFHTLQQVYTDTSITFKPFINYVADSYSAGVPDGLDFNQTGSNVVTLTFDAENDPNAQFFILSSGYIHFTNSIDMVLTNGAKASNIFWLAEGGNITADKNNTKYGNFISNNGIDFSSSNPITINGNLFHFGPGDSIVFNASGDSILGQGGPVVCYLKGTKILTQRGHVAIENICSTDRIVTKGKIINNDTLAKDNFKLEPIVWLSKFKVKQPSSESFPICIKQNALGPNRPFEDLFVSPNHGILVKGNVVRAKDLVNENTIFQDWSKNSLTYYHLELKNHSAIVANGVLSESYLDMNNRYSFEPRESFEPIRKSETIIVKNKNKNKNKNINAAKLVNFINQAVKTIKCNKKVQKQSNMIKTF